MMVKEASTPKAETLMLKRESSADGLKAKVSLHSLPTSESNFAKNGTKFQIGRPAAVVTPTGHPPTGRYRRNTRATSAERTRCSSGSPYIKRKLMARRQSVYKIDTEQGPMPKSTSFSNSSLASSRDSSVMSPNSGSAQFFVQPQSANKNFKNIYEKLLWQHQYDEASQKDVTLGRRVGFYKFKSDLGSGNFSKVKLGVHQLTKERVAVKIINKTRLDSKTQKMVQREMKIMDALSHPNLIRLYEVCETVTSIHLVMEMAPNGELFAQLSEEGPYKENQAKGIFAQIASAVQYMHDYLFIHRDLKAENVFFSDRMLASGPPKDRVSYPMVKVGDFGFATQVNSIDQHLNTFCGSPPYAAPELFKDDHYVGPAVDIWALGILLYFLVTGAMPFKGSTVASLKHSILEGKFDLPDNLSENCMELIRGILRKKPEWRLNMQQIRESRWLLGINWPSPDSKYRPFPMKNSTDPSFVSPEEAEVRTELEAIGIDSDLLESHIERGNTSPIIGSYRILMHRVITGGERKNSKDWSIIECQSVDSQFSPNGKNKRLTTLNRDKLSSRGGVSTPVEEEKPIKKSKTKVSKFCNIL